MSKYKNTTGLNNKFSFRLRKEEKKAIEEIIKNKQDKYNSPSHFIRCSIIKNIREEQEMLQ